MARTSGKDDAETSPRGFVLELVDGIPDAFGEYVSSCKVVDQGPAQNEPKSKKGKKHEPHMPDGPKQKSRSPNGEVIYMALVGLFAKTGVPQEREITPGKPKLRSITRDQLREYLKAAGLIEGTATGAMTAKERSRLHEVLLVLVGRKDIVMNAELIALAPAPGDDWWTASAAVEPAACPD
jgi:hypothetical protein